MAKTISGFKSGHITTQGMLVKYDPEWMYLINTSNPNHMLRVSLNYNIGWTPEPFGRSEKVNIRWVDYSKDGGKTWKLYDDRFLERKLYYIPHLEDIFKYGNNPRRRKAKRNPLKQLQSIKINGKWVKVGDYGTFIKDGCEHITGYVNRIVESKNYVTVSIKTNHGPRLIRIM